MPKPVVVAELVRSGFVEGHHHGSVVALDRDGAVDWSVGDVDGRSCRGRATSRSRRSAMVRLGLDLPPELLALACASHSGEPFHLDGVRRILASAGLTEGALQTPPDYPLEDAEWHAVVAGRRRADAAPDELLGQARGDARHLRRQRLGHSTPTSTPTTRSSGRSGRPSRS